MQPPIGGSPSTDRVERFWSPSRITTLGLVVFAFGWVWFGVAFTARAPAWWNSPWIGMTIFAAATAIAARGERSRHGYGVLIISAVFLLVMIGLQFG